MRGGISIIIKICGITCLETALAARDCSADLIGFVFADSKRRIAVQKAADICAQVTGIGKVGVFVNMALQAVRDIAGRCNLDLVQLHGDEPPEYCRLVGRPVIKAFRAGAGVNLPQIEDYAVDWVLLDSFHQGRFGGTGATFDWRQAETLSHRLNKPLMVAGGLTADNVADAIKIIGPAGVDVSGGVETNGVKDMAKIRQFIIAARQAGNRDGGRRQLRSELPGRKGEWY